MIAETRKTQPAEQVLAIFLQDQNLPSEGSLTRKTLRASANLGRVGPFFARGARDSISHPIGGGIHLRNSRRRWWTGRLVQFPFTSTIDGDTIFALVGGVVRMVILAWTTAALLLAESQHT